MAKKTTPNTQLTELAESLKAKTEITPQTVIETTELESLKTKAEQVPETTGRRKGTFSFTLPNDIIKLLDDERAKQPFNPSRSEYLEHIIREYFKDRN